MQIDWKHLSPYKLQINTTQPIFIHFSWNLYQNFQHEKLYLDMAMVWRIKRFEILTSWRAVWENKRFKCQKCPDPILRWWLEVWCMNWSLRWLGSSSDFNFHLHVLELHVLNSSSNSSSKCLDLTRICKKIAMLCEEISDLDWEKQNGGKNVI